MNEKFPIQKAESSVGLLKNKVNNLLSSIFEDSDIQNINVTPSSEEEWRVHMPTLSLVTSYGEKNLRTIYLQRISFGQLSTDHIFVTFTESTSVEFHTDSSGHIIFIGPIETGNLFKVQRNIEINIDEDNDRLRALKEVLEYCLLIKEIDQIGNERKP